MKGSETGNRQHPLWRHRSDMEQGSKPPGRGRKASAMDWKSIRKTLNTGLAEPASRFTCVALDEMGTREDLKGSLRAAEATQTRDWWSLGRAGRGRTRSRQ